MCGIMGYIGNDASAPVLLRGLERLAYRGYDSAGIALGDGTALTVYRQPGKLAALRATLDGLALPHTLGIGHTRWATHGEPSERNAHPHTDPQARIAVVHNGIIENFAGLRRDLESNGAPFRSETDSEVLAHLIAAAYRGDLLDAVRGALAKVEGSYAIAVLAADQPRRIVVARQGSPLLIARAGGACWLASDALPLVEHAHEAVYLQNGTLAEIVAGAVRIVGLDGTERAPRWETLPAQAADAERGRYPHYMLKEIHEQPLVLRRMLERHTDGTQPRVHIEGALPPLEAIRRIVIVACGTAWHAGLVARYWLEPWGRVPVSVELASEFRYRGPALDGETLVVAISQSGETADTLEAIRLAKNLHAWTLGVINVRGSSLARECHAACFLEAGPEIGVASTKAYTAQLGLLALLALQVSAERGTLDEAALTQHVAGLRAVPQRMDEALAHANAIDALAAYPRYRDAVHAMFIGRHYNFPSALEGALKLKEISYIHVEGYGAGEMKHGPLALVTDGLPVVAIATASGVYDKMLSNILEIRARGGNILALATEGDTQLAPYCRDVLYLPPCAEAFSPLLNAIPLQLFAYYVAVHLGRDIDQPRNLAKSVTVE